MDEIPGAGGQVGAQQNQAGAQVNEQNAQYNEQATQLDEHGARKTRWWMPPPAPADAPVITARRAYGEVLGLYGIFFAAPILLAAFSLAGDNVSPGREGWTIALPGVLEVLGVIAACIMLPLLLTERRQGTARRPLGLVAPPAPSGSKGIRMAAWATLALIAGGIVTNFTASGGFPQVPHTIPLLVKSLADAVQAGFIEEIVVLAFVVVTLEQARRPRAEIVVVALILRCAYHIYYGPGVLGILVWASIFIWLFLRFRSIVPLIAVHSAWDFIIMLIHQWKNIAPFEMLLFLLLFVVAPILWLVERSNNKQQAFAAQGYGGYWAPGPPVAPPGWYPDPGGAPHHRWFDGRWWTYHTYPPGQ